MSLLSIARPLPSQVGKANKSATHKQRFHFFIKQEFTYTVVLNIENKLFFYLPFPIFFLLFFAPRYFLPLSTKRMKERHVSLFFISQILLAM